MKKIRCCNFDGGCSERRIHHENPDVSRGIQSREVEDSYDMPWFCSFTCAMLAGFMSVRAEDKTVGMEAFELQYPNWRERIEVK